MTPEDAAVARTNLLASGVPLLTGQNVKVHGAPIGATLSLSAIQTAAAPAPPQQRAPAAPSQQPVLATASSVPVTAAPVKAKAVAATAVTATGAANATATATAAAVEAAAASAAAAGGAAARSRAATVVAKFGAAATRPVCAAPAVLPAAEPRAAGPVTEVDGVRLHLSSTNVSGYHGVHTLANGKFKAEVHRDGSTTYLGLYDSRVEAAVSIARFHQSIGAALGYDRPHDT